MIPLSVFVVCFLVSLLLCRAAIEMPPKLYNPKHMVKDLSARQALHERPTPRIGGAAVIISMLAVGFMVRRELGQDLVAVMVAGLIVFAVGLREDLARDVSPRVRFFAAFVSAIVAVVLSGHTIPGLGLGTADIIFDWALVALLVTLLWSAGSCHAVNLIDGLNGLAGGYAVAAAIGFWLIAGYTGDTDIQIVAGLLIAALLGFLILNWPMGWIFLGDGGAYAIGHVLGWLGLLLMVRNPEVAGTALLLVMFWPVADTTYSIIRRRIQRRATGLPDKLHFHHLVVRAIPLMLRSGRKMSRDNSLATLVMVPLFSAPVFLGVFGWDRGGVALILLACLTVIFIVSYVNAISYFSSRRFRKSEEREEAAVDGALSGQQIANLPPAE